MKKLSAILLLALFAFNLAGYRLFFSYLQQQHKVSLEASLDKNEYQNKDLLELRIPLSMPYISSQSDFERIDGEVNIQGKSYKYVKRKVENGQLVLLCLPDVQKMHLDNAKNEFGSHTNDLPAAGKKGAESIKKTNFVAEYEEATQPAFTTRTSIFANGQMHTQTTSLSQGFLDFTDKPPDNSRS